MKSKAPKGAFRRVAQQFGESVPSGVLRDDVSLREHRQRVRTAASRVRAAEGDSALPVLLAAVADQERYLDEIGPRYFTPPWED